MRLRRRTHRVAQWLSGVAALVGAWVLGVSPAMAGIGGGDIPTWPATAQVGQLIQTSVLITNQSSSPNNTENVNLTSLFVTPACAGSGTTCPAGSEDPGIFKVLTAQGDASTPPCAGVLFDIGVPNAVTGEVQLTPQSTVALDPTSGGTNLSCQVNLQLRVFAVPTNPAPGLPVSTNALTRATLLGANSNLDGTAGGSATIRIFKAVTELITTSSPSQTTVLPGTSVTDSVTVVKAPGAAVPTGTVRFFLCQPGQVDGTGCPPLPGTQVGSAKVLAGSPATATSDSTTNTTNIGKYCWRARYFGDANYEGVITHTNTDTECFTTAASAPTVETLSAPNTGGVAPGTSVTDAVTVSGGAGQLTPTGSVTFFLCQPADVTAGGCVTGGAAVGSAKTLDASGHATSDASTNTNTPGKYCWRAEYSGDTIYTPQNHTNGTTECFTVEVTTTALCKTPGYWGNHPAITQLALEQAMDKVGGGPLTICGQPVDTTAVPGPRSAIEAICVKPPTDPLNPLKAGRNLMVTALNCAITDPSGSPTTVCNNVAISELFEACNTECANVAGTGTAVVVTLNNVVIDCNPALDCYNNGFGFDPSTSQCTGAVDSACLHESSVIGTCSGSGDLCSNNQACPQGETCDEQAADPASCQEARGNSCTIFGGIC